MTLAIRLDSSTLVPCGLRMLMMPYRGSISGNNSTPLPHLA